MAMILKWGFAVVIPYISFEGGFHFEGFQLFEIRDVSPLLAIFITLCMTVSFGWIQGWIVVKSGISSFIVTLGGLFFLRGLTEVSYRAFNRAPDQTAGSTTVTDLPDIKNIINVPGLGEMERDAAKALPNDQLLEILSTAPASTVAKLTEQLTYVNEKVAAFKTEINSTKMIETLEKSLAGAKKIWQ
jgi:simple sugar transport system permease protein